jgi:secreted PhoX family phosphatase
MTKAGEAPGGSAPEEIEDIGSNPDPRRPIGTVIRERLGRRDALRGLLGAGAAAGLAQRLLSSTAALAQAPPQAHSSGNPPGAGISTLSFPELRHQSTEGDAVAEGHEIQAVLRWGDPILADAPEFDPLGQSAEAQARQFGYNCDYLDFFPLPQGSRSSEHGLLAVNHEYASTQLMFPGLGAGSQARRRVTEAQARIEMAAHGMSVVELRRDAGGRWSAVRDSRFNRRVTATTPMRISGPAAGHPRLRTTADPEGVRALGTLNNCAGGNTPWGTVLTAEENFNLYFIGDAAETGEQSAIYKRYALTKAGSYAWGRFESRFNLDREPNEPNRFGWVVEFDPYDPDSVPVKRTAIGRFKHEGCTHAVAPDGRVVIYSGDDERFEYLYKFVTARPWNPGNRAANRDLLDDGTLFVARFEADGTMRWLPLIHGQGPLTAANGFRSQGDVLVETRRAADLLGATPMDRPEDVETNPVNGRVYAMLTNNVRRTEAQVNPANPRPRNLHGHVLEIVPPDADRGAPDHAADAMRWEIFIAGGKPGADHGAQYHRATSDVGWLSCPDNCAFDSRGRIWISTDGMDDAAGLADGVYAADTAGKGRGLTRLFYQAPTGAEVAGPRFTPDDTTLFLSIQHPAEEDGSSYDNPSTRWPDFRPDLPPRPSVIAITRRGGGPVG